MSRLLSTETSSAQESAGAPVINLDTHVLVFALQGDITARERRILAANPWSVSAIVLWELAKLVQLGRVDMDLENGEILRRLSALHVWAIDLAVSVQSTKLDFRGDPADEFIAATSVVYSIPRAVALPLSHHVSCDGDGSATDSPGTTSAR